MNKLISNLYIKINSNTAFKVIAFIDSDLVDNFSHGAVIDTVDDTAIIASLDKTDLADVDWYYDENISELQIGHHFIRI
jgi:hypothetical protein